MLTNVPAEADIKQSASRSRRTLMAAARKLHDAGRFPTLLFADLNQVAWINPTNNLQRPHLAVSAPGIVVVQALRWSYGFIVLTPDGLLNLPDSYSATSDTDLVFKYRPTLPGDAWASRLADDATWYKYAANIKGYLKVAAHYPTPETPSDIPAILRPVIHPY